MSVKGVFKISLLDGDPYLAEEFDVELNVLTARDVSYSEEKVKRFWRCRDCGYVWDALVKNRTRLKTGCPCCSNNVCVPHINSLSKINPTLASEWHPNKNGAKTPYDFQAGSNKYAWWLCKKCGHAWEAIINTRNSQTTGCPECVKRTRTSFPEKAVYFYMKQVFPNTKTCYKINGVEADIFIPEVNLVIEYDGLLYHQHKEGKDLKKNEYFAEYNMLRVREIGLVHLLDYDCLNFTLDPQNKTQFKEVIERIFCHITSLGHSITDLPDIDIRRDSIAIKSLTTRVEVENSFTFKRPDLVYLWNTSGINGGLTPDSTYGNATIDIHWVCPKWHNYTMSPDRMSRTKIGNTGCPHCSNKIISTGYNDLATTHPMIAREFIKNLSSDRTQYELPFGSADLVLWTCNDCKEPFECKVQIRTGKWAQDCPRCMSKPKPIKLKNSLYFDSTLVGIRFLYGRRLVDISIESYNNLSLPLILDTYAREELLEYKGSLKTQEEIDNGWIITDYSEEPKFIKRLKKFFTH